MKKTQWMQSVLLGGSLALVSHGAAAQQEPPPQGASANTMVLVGGQGPLALPPVLPPVGVNVMARIVGKVVTGKPYFADAITETTQTLADGNRIVTRSEARIYRDSSGRTRREQKVTRPVAVSADGGPVEIVSIDDPVAKVSYLLDAQTHTARELHPVRFEAQSSAPQDGAKGVVSFSLQRDNVVFERKVPPPASAGQPPQEVIVESRAGAPNAEPAAPSPLPFPAAGPVVAYTFVSAGTALADQGRTEDLGDEVIQGVLAHGTRTTHTIPAGAIGNELPIDVVSESWYSEDLGEIVLSRFTDPRVGETTYRLENVVREEPAPELFTVPSDYKLIADNGPAAGVRVEQDGGPGTRVERRVFIAPRSSADQ